MLRGDILRAVDGAQVDTLAGLRVAIAGKKAGSTITLSLSRGETELSRSLTIEDRPYRPALGLVLLPGSADEPPGAFPSVPLPFSPAAAVTAVVPGSPADMAGIAVGDLIAAIDGAPLGFPPDLAAAISKYRPGDSVTLSVIDSGGGRKDVVVKLDQAPDAKGVARLGVRYEMRFGTPMTPEDGNERMRRRPSRNRISPLRAPSASSL